MTKENRVRLRFAPRGTTILEALIALLILSAITMSIVSLIVTGDRIAGRRTGVSHATTLARNEAERLRAEESAVVLQGDTTYYDTVNGIVFEVLRTRIGDKLPPPDSVVRYQEYAISVKRMPPPGPAVSFRMLVGYNGTPVK
jgi:type II secretory pathway pseudopilin PulG